jgi:hypothetical protein
MTMDVSSAGSGEAGAVGSPAHYNKSNHRDTESTEGRRGRAPKRARKEFGAGIRGERPAPNGMLI